MDIMFPPGRMVGGNLDKLFPRTEANGTPKIGKDGKPELQCSFGCAIPKGAESDWRQTEWGAKVFQVGQEAHKAMVASPAFSWKITDGDSTIPNKKGKLPCNQVGYAGHWVIWFSQGWLPKKCNADGSAEITTEGAIVPGYYIQVFGAVMGNKLVPNGTPGVYMNPIAVALIGEGDKIAVDVDTAAVGFGSAALPAGARPVAPAVAAFAPAAPVAVKPNPAILQVAPPAPPAPPAHVMTAATNGVTYEAYVAAGWTDEQLVSSGLMVG